jgi:hypothetical protein
MSGFIGLILVEGRTEESFTVDANLKDDILVQFIPEYGGNSFPPVLVNTHQIRWRHSQKHLYMTDFQPDVP